MTRGSSYFLFAIWTFNRYPEDVPQISVGINYYPEAFFERSSCISMYGDEDDDFQIKIDGKEVGKKSAQAVREVLQDVEQNVDGMVDDWIKKEGDAI